MDNYIQHKADINSFGKVIAIGDGVARVFGLSDVQAGEISLLVKTGPIFGIFIVNSHKQIFIENPNDCS